MPAKEIEVRLDRGAPGRLMRHYWAAPLTLGLTHPDGVWNGCIEVRVEIHDQRVTAGETPLAAASVGLPTTDRVEAHFSSAQMRLPMNGAKVKTFWMLVRATWPESVPGDGNDVDVYHLGQLDLEAHPASDMAAEPPPPVELYAPVSVVDFLAAQIADAAPQAALAAEINDRAQADAALQAQVNDKIPVADIGISVAPVVGGLIPPAYLGTLILDGGYVTEGLFSPSKILHGGTLP